MVDISDMAYEEMVSELIAKAEREGYKPKKKPRRERARRVSITGEQIQSICDIDQGTFESCFVYQPKR